MLCEAGRYLKHSRHFLRSELITHNFGFSKMKKNTTIVSDW